MSHFKYQTPEALAAWDKLQADQKQMRSEGAKFAAIFGGRPVYSNNISRSRFHGVKFDDAFYVAKELWTKPTSSTGFASWPKARAPKGLIEEYKALTELWKANHPKVSVDIDEFYKAVGFDWGMLLICGFTYFAFDGAIYVSTKAKPQDGFGAVEIVGSEFDKAKAGYLDAKA